MEQEKQALAILEQAASLASMVKADHIKCAQAVEILKKVIEKKSVKEEKAAE